LTKYFTLNTSIHYAQKCELCSFPIRVADIQITKTLNWPTRSIVVA